MSVNIAWKVALEGAQHKIKHLEAEIKRLRAENARLVRLHQMTMPEQVAEIERLTGLADYWHRMHDAVHEDRERMRAEHNLCVEMLKSAEAERDELLAALKAARKWMPDPPTGPHSAFDLGNVDGTIAKAEGK